MLSYHADSRASAATAWRLISEPDLWHHWAPHIRGGWGLGSPEVSPGRLGFARLGGVIPVPVQIREKRASRSWSWRTGPTRFDHIVVSRDSGCRITITMSAPWPIEPLLRVSYGPIVATVVRRLARTAEAYDAEASASANAA
jgi:Polyketide cyclase / dehydrase and lipid transport